MTISYSPLTRARNKDTSSSSSSPSSSRIRPPSDNESSGA